MPNVEYSPDGKALLKAEGIEGHFVIPEGVTEIGENAFRGCTGLTAIELPDSVIEIGCYAFSGCVYLQEINFPASLKRIGLQAFIGCPLIKRPADLPDSVAVMSNSFDK